MSTVTDDQIKDALTAVKAKKGRPGLSKEERERREAAAAQEKADRKARREQEKLARAQKATNKAPVHMKKVERAAARLPTLNERAKEAIEGLVNAFDAAETTAIIAHVTHRLRTQATLSAQTVQLTEGQLVRIHDATSRFNGQLARVTDVRRIRCYVAPLSAPERSEYLFNSSVVAVDESEAIDVASVPTDDRLEAVG